MAAGGPGSGHHLLMGGVGASEFDVVLHTVLEEIHILKNHGDIPQQALAGELTQPDGPTMAVVVPWGAVKVTSWSTSRWP